ncbi:Mannosyl-oligosaccharide alpha-1,2-mannosidase isoform B [Ooceraea biroi]|uniref:Mannosyl-oligosaccharide alpha-1,2-mannosidase isoform B n=1 Tax=Ooceraea biroi TaxID=2015173 RepID=A0A026W7S7_OOCBI|nr:Mannosyl-oligosaccharide alpha-1,2-mannosidase isoform B [Ooceraea biroi]
MGSLLACYALTGDVMFRDKAAQLGERMLPAFQTETGIPHSLINLHTGASKNYGWASSGCSILSEIGTMHLEFTYLSDITNNPVFKSKVENVRKVLKSLDKPKGLYPNYIHPRTGKWGQPVHRVGLLLTNWYRKPTFSDRCINFFSNHLRKYKLNTIVNLVDQAILLSDSRFHETNIKIVEDVLLNNCMFFTDTHGLFLVHFYVESCKDSSHINTEPCHCSFVTTRVMLAEDTIISLLLVYHTYNYIVEIVILNQAILLSDSRFHETNIKIVEDVLLNNCFPIALIRTVIKQRVRKLKMRNNNDLAETTSSNDKKKQHITLPYCGMFALGAKTLENELSDKYMNIAAGLTNTCHESYDRSATKLGPEAFHFIEGNEARSLKNGEKYYILRPETFESYFVMWRLTKDPKYREWGWEAVQALEKHCRVPGGFTGLNNVYLVDSAKDDVQQSYFFAETLKYLYLLFSDDDLISLDDWVFNSEAHVLPIRGNPLYRPAPPL